MELLVIGCIDLLWAKNETVTNAEYLIVKIPNIGKVLHRMF